jgi:hypothetical protein
MLTLIAVVVGLVILTSLGLFTFELTRADTARQELRSACEAAALAGASSLASSDFTDPTVTHTNAINAAIEAFNANSLVGFSIAPADTASMNLSNSLSYVPPATESAIFVQLLDKDNKPVPKGDPEGRTIHVVGAHGLQPAFGKFLGIDNAPIRAESFARVPSLDLVLCFDVSGSIDDQTPVTFVKRSWNPSKPKNDGSGSGAIDYLICEARPGSAAAPLAQGRIYDILKPAPSGTGLNAEYPQNLSQAKSNTYGLQFRSDLRTNNPAKDNGAPPGDFPSGAGYGKYEFSDLVVNIDGKKTFGGVSIGGFDFPDLATLVEAARGNLEDNGVFASSMARFSVPTSITAKAGYQAAYMAAAHKATMPIGAAREAAKTFFQIMNTNTDAHFGLVTFSTGASSNPAGNFKDYRVDYGYNAAGIGTFPFVGTQLNATSTNYSTVSSQIDLTLAYGCTDMGNACTQAVDMLKKSSGMSRKGAKKAIVFFTDGQPTCGPSWKSAAAQAKSEGIAIYTVGLAQDSAIIPGECENLNAGKGSTITYTDPSTSTVATYTPSADGMSATAGNGGKFFLVTNTANLRYVFENIARQLVQLVRLG